MVSCLESLRISVHCLNQCEGLYNVGKKYKGSRTRAKSHQRAQSHDITLPQCTSRSAANQLFASHAMPVFWLLSFQFGWLLRECKSCWPRASAVCAAQVAVLFPPLLGKGRCSANMKRAVDVMLYVYPVAMLLRSDTTPAHTVGRFPAGKLSHARTMRLYS